MNQWPIIDAASVNCDWDEGLEIAEHAAEAQRRSDWQHAWAQAATELRVLTDADYLDGDGYYVLRTTDLDALATTWEQRAKEEQP